MGAANPGGYRGADRKGKTGLLTSRIQSISLQQTAGRWSNIGLGLEIGSAALAYCIGCGKHHSYLRDNWI